MKKPSPNALERRLRSIQLIAVDREYRQRWKATEELFDRISVDRTRHRNENIGIAAQKTSLLFRDYFKTSRVLKMRHHRAEIAKEARPKSDVSVLRRMRSALNRDKRHLFLKANAELPLGVARSLMDRGRKNDDAVIINDPWLLLFVLGPSTQAYDKFVPSKIECLRVFDEAIAEAKPGRPKNIHSHSLVVELIIRWSNHTKCDLREPGHKGGSTERSGKLADFLGEIGRIWNVRLISSNSGSAMKKAISEAREKLGG